jgi:predicted amidophosphoribosyltransferase
MLFTSHPHMTACRECHKLTPAKYLMCSQCGKQASLYLKYWIYGPLPKIFWGTVAFFILKTILYG